MPESRISRHKEPHSPQAGPEIKATPEMIEAGVEVYDRWESDNLLDDPYGGAAPYAVRELVVAIYRAMRSIEGREAEGKQAIRSQSSKCDKPDSQCLSP